MAMASATKPSRYANPKPAQKLATTGKKNGTIGRIINLEDYLQRGNAITSEQAYPGQLPPPNMSKQHEQQRPPHDVGGDGGQDYY